MSKSSGLSNQLRFDFLGLDIGGTGANEDGGGLLNRFLSRNAESAPSSQSAAKGRDPVYADAARIAARLNAASATDRELDQLIEERRVLLAKKMHGALSRAEEHKLTLVAWHIDRIEDAAHGWYLDALQGAIDEYHRFGADVHDLVQQLKQNMGSR